MNYIGSKQTDIKRSNQKLILHFLIDHGPSSRADISKQIYCSKPTVSKNVDELMTKGLLIEGGKSDNSLGKKGVLIDFNKRYGYVLAIDLSKDKVKVALSNLRGEIEADTAKSFKTHMKGKMFLETFLKDSGIAQEQIMKVVVAYPGIVGHNGQFYLSNAKEKEILLKELIAYVVENLNRHPLIVNDINLAIIAEKELSDYRQYHNLYYMSVDRGVGSAMMIEDKLYEGDRNAAGEIGSMRFASKDHKAYCSLEDLIAIEAIIERYAQVAHKRVTYEELVYLIKEKETRALALYEEIVQYISMTIINVTSVLDIQGVIIAGRVVQLAPHMRTDIAQKIDEVLHQEIHIHSSQLENPSLIGAIYKGLNEVIEGLELNDI